VTPSISTDFPSNVRVAMMMTRTTTMSVLEGRRKKWALSQEIVDDSLSWNGNDNRTACIFLEN
jgi:hypothetical protein